MFFAHAFVRLCLFALRWHYAQEVTKFLATPIADTTSFFASQFRISCGCNGTPLAWVANTINRSMTVSVSGNSLYNSTNSLRFSS